MGDKPRRGVLEQVMADVLTEKQMRKADRTPEGHLLWKGGLANGYPAAKHHGKTVYLKRLLWEESYGPIPGDLVVVSACGERTCVEPSHLALRGPGRYPCVKDARGKYARVEPATAAESGSAE